MPYIIEETKKLFAIYVLLFEEENTFYVWKIQEKNLLKAYKRHYYGECVKTKEYFSTAKNRNKPPPMYLLNTVEATEQHAFLHCVAWTKYFMDQGYDSLCGEFQDRYADNMGNECQQIFETIQNKDFNEICSAEKNLFPHYGMKRPRIEGGKQDLIGFRTNKSEYKKIQKIAAGCSLTVSEYCKTMALNGRVINVDLEVINVFSTYINEFVARDQLLKKFQATILSTGVYYPVDIETIQKAIKDNREQQEIAINQLKILIKTLLDKS